MSVIFGSLDNTSSSFFVTSVMIFSLWFDFLFVNERGDRGRGLFDSFSIMTFTDFSPLLNLYSIAGSILAFTIANKSKTRVNNRRIFFIIFLDLAKF